MNALRGREQFGLLLIQTPTALATQTVSSGVYSHHDMVIRTSPIWLGFRREREIERLMPPEFSTLQREITEYLASHPRLMSSDHNLNDSILSAKSKVKQKTAANHHVWTQNETSWNTNVSIMSDKNRVDPETWASLHASGSWEEFISFVLCTCFHIPTFQGETQKSMGVCSWTSKMLVTFLLRTNIPLPIHCVFLSFLMTWKLNSLQEFQMEKSASKRLKLFNSSFINTPNWWCHWDLSFLDLL